MFPPSYVSFSICILLICVPSPVSPLLCISPFSMSLLSYVSPSYVLSYVLPSYVFPILMYLPRMCPSSYVSPYYLFPLYYVSLSYVSLLVCILPSICLCIPSLYLNNKISCMNIRPAPITLFRRIIYIYRPFFPVLIWNCIYSYLILFLDKVVHPD